jgi:AbrB family looped-hinge helix DNA binding protein
MPCIQALSVGDGNLIAIKWHGRYHNGMKTTIDGAGRIVVPKAVRDQLHLMPGSELEIDVLDNSVVIRHRDASEPLVEKQGILIHRGPKQTDIDVVAFLRTQRDARADEQVHRPRQR